MIAILQISCRMWQWKNFENLPVFAEVTRRIRYRGGYFWPTLQLHVRVRTCKFASVHIRPSSQFAARHD